MKRIFLLTLALVFILTAAPAMAGKIKIGVSIPSADHGWTGGIVWWAKKAIDDWKVQNPDVEFFLVTADTAAKQVDDVEDLMVKGINALVILPHDSAPLTPTVVKAYESGIYTVVVDRGLTKPGQSLYIAGDNPGMGRVSAEWMAKELGGKGKVVVLEGIPCVINSERVNAFNTVMASFKGIEILDSQPSHWSTQKGLEIMENYLQKYPHIDAVWAQDDDVLKGVLQAYKESGRSDIKLFLGGAGSKDMIKMVMDGDPLVRADVTYHPSMIASAITLGVMALENPKVQNFIPAKLTIGAELITKENAKHFYEPKSIY